MKNRARRKTLTNIIHANIIARTSQIVVGDIYFLSSFYDKDGAMVQVTAKSFKSNNAGWPSSVEYVVLERIGDAYAGMYSPGCVGTCNAFNLYERRDLASHARARSRRPSG